MPRLVEISLLVGVLLASGSSRAENATYINAYQPFRGPVGYADDSIKTIFYVETDGRHLSAIGFDGKVFWTRDPFADARLTPYRVDNPKIIWVGKPLPWMLKPHGDPNHHYVAIGFDSTQSGIVDTSTGEFLFLGQD